MADASITPSTGWRRHTMGGCAVILLTLGIVFCIWPPSDASAKFLQGSLIKSGLVLGAAWLAFPQLDRLPGWLFASVVGVLLAVAVRPRIVLALSRYLIMIAPILFVIWLLRRMRFRSAGQ